MYSDYLDLHRPDYDIFTWFSSKYIYNSFGRPRLKLHGSYPLLLDRASTVSTIGVLHACTHYLRSPACSIAAFKASPIPDGFVAFAICVVFFPNSLPPEWSDPGSNMLLAVAASPFLSRLPFPRDLEILLAAAFPISIVTLPRLLLPSSSVPGARMLAALLWSAAPCWSGLPDPKPICLASFGCKVSLRLSKIDLSFSGCCRGRL
jgi:hypothetical protein